MPTHTELWNAIRAEAEAASHDEPLLTGFFADMILNQPSLESAVAATLSRKLACLYINAEARLNLISAVMHESEVLDAVCADILAVYERDPACKNYMQPLLYFKGFQALQSYRVAHWLWQQNKKQLALYVQSQISEVFDVDIHPAAQIGKGILIDHATGVVIGETAVVEDNVSMLHAVTLGGTGKERGDRHPKIKQGVLIGAGAKILGNIVVGAGAKIAASSVVLKDVPEHATVAGIPAKVIGTTLATPAIEMNHDLPEKKPELLKPNQAN
jgi:serine O-acetyltransferase